MPPCQIRISKWSQLIRQDIIGFFSKRKKCDKVSTTAVHVLTMDNSATLLKGSSVIHRGLQGSVMHKGCKVCLEKNALAY